LKLRLVKAGISLLCGVLLFLSCADFDIWPFAWFALVPLFWVILDERTVKPAYYGFLCGLVANGGGFYWIVGFLQRFGHLPLIAAIPIFLLLVSYQAITFAAWAWIVRKLNDRLEHGVTFMAPVAYVAVELVVPYVFPWYLAITQAWVRPVIQIADLTGPLGVSFLLVMVNGALWELIAALRNKSPLPRRRLVAAALVVVASLGYGALRIHQVTKSREAAPKLAVGVVQANVGIHEKWHQSLALQQLDLHQKLSADLERRGAKLIVWPESSYPFGFGRDQAHDYAWPHPGRVQAGFATPLLFGTLTSSGGGDSYNSAMLLDGTGNVQGIFDKNILMVFGEYIPYYEQMKWLKHYIPELSNWSRGTDVTVFPLKLPSLTVNLGPMICYEDIFPSFGRRLAKLGPNLLINITNDAWFGRTSEPYEHLALSVYRAVELRVDLVRAVNTGVSAFVDSTGRVYKKGPSVDPDEKQRDNRPVTLLDEAAIQQPFTLYAMLGEWFGGACLLVLLALGLRARALGGNPVRWRLAAVGAAALGVAIIVGSAVLAGPSRVGLALALIAHRALPPGSADAAFSTGVRLFPVVALGCALAGVAIARQNRGRAPLESALAVLAILVVPALALGTLEGEQAGLVLTALAGIGVASLAARIYYRRFVPAAVEPTQPPDEPKRDQPKRNRPKRKRKR
jgi:apolipoprotein N-acyltransferase